MATKLSAGDWVQTLVYAIGAYALYRLFKKTAEVGDDIVDAIAKPIADTYLKATLPGAVNVKGMAILPNGQTVSVGLITLDKNFIFAYQGRRYKLGARNAQGNWPATLV